VGAGAEKGRKHWEKWPGNEKRRERSLSAFWRLVLGFVVPQKNKKLPEPFTIHITGLWSKVHTKPTSYVSAATTFFTLGTCFRKEEGTPTALLRQPVIRCDWPATTRLFWIPVSSGIGPSWPDFSESVGPE
jgi:hypothetical protein